jgi:hypothetical protein
MTSVDLGSGPHSSNSLTRGNFANKLAASQLAWQQKTNKLLHTHDCVSPSGTRCNLPTISGNLATYVAARLSSGAHGNASSEIESGGPGRLLRVWDCAKPASSRRLSVLRQDLERTHRRSVAGKSSSFRSYRARCTNSRSGRARMARGYLSVASMNRVESKLPGPDFITWLGERFTRHEI